MREYVDSEERNLFHLSADSHVDDNRPYGLIWTAACTCKDTHIIISVQSVAIKQSCLVNQTTPSAALDVLHHQHATVSSQRSFFTFYVNVS